MKHYSVMLWLCLAICIASCNKNDCPPGQELWQVNKSERGSGRYQYKYDNNRSLIQITALPWSFGPNFILTSDQLKRPRSLRDSISTAYEEFIYQGARLIRVDGHPGPNTPGSPITSFTYDNKGRIIKKDGRANYYSYVKYEYEGNSRNFKRALFYNAPSAAKASQEQDAALILEYAYDNKINPFSTFLYTEVIPFWMTEYMGPTFYDPIVPNNVVNQKFWGKVDTGYFKFMEYKYTYVYDHNYPVSHTLKRTTFNYDGTIAFESTESGAHTYDKFPR